VGFVSSPMPVLAELLIDEEGNVWAREFSLPGEEANRWSVFSPAGTWLGTLDAPAGMRILSVSSGHVVGLTRDAFQVEVVSVYRLEKAGR
jgi:hypothetical protein